MRRHSQPAVFDGLRLYTGVIGGRLTALAIRAARLGGATTMPGRVARALDPRILEHLSRRLAQGTVLITGTNGKTTTSRVLTAVLRAAGLSVIHNRAGANLPAGIGTALVTHTSPVGAVRGDIGVFEVDEATLPLVVGPLAPRVVVMGNLFRDQLDRYGEIDLVADRWRTALERIGPKTVLLYNADDPLVADVGRQHPGAHTFGIEDSSVGRGAVLEHAADARYCYRCGIPYTYPVVYLGHLGIYRCERCGTARPAVDIVAKNVSMRGVAGSRFTLHSAAAHADITTVLPGLYNVYNLLAAAGAAVALGIHSSAVSAAVRDFVPAFGRGERFAIGDREVYILLAKNPAGFNEVLRTVLADGMPITAVIAINDLTADGHDISWLWDVDFEMLRGSAHCVVVTGLRAEDMAVRLKYAGLDGNRVSFEKDEERAINLGLEAVGDRPLFIIPTYTAMLKIRELLSRKGYIKAFWED